MKPLSRQAQALIDSARAAEAPPDAYHAHMRRRLQAQLGAAMGAATVTAVAREAAGAKAGAPNGVAAHAAGGGIITKAGVTIAILGVLAGGGALLWRNASGGQGAVRALEGIEAFAAGLERPSLEASPEPLPAPSGQPTPATVRASEVPPPHAPPAHPRRAATAVPRRGAAPSSPAPHPTPDRALNEELALLTRAQGALSSGAADRALELLDEHAATYPDGALREERLAARVFALCALGRAEQAHAEARQFVLNAPRSPLAARVRTACPAGESAVPKGGPAGESSAPKP